jgi:shikimate dehydrogenase
MKIYAVAGSPVFHSRSPVMFNAAFRALGVDSHYVRLSAATAREVVASARAMGMGGLNVTSPFKTDIMGYLDGVEADARQVGSVNTVVRRDGRLIGSNTDVAGVQGALGSAGFQPRGRKGVVLGVGGAARAAAFALVSAGARVILANRTFGKARDAAQDLGCEAASLDDLPKALKEADLLVSAIPSGAPVVDPSLLRPDLVVLDALYEKPTALIMDAANAGCTVIDGREWFLSQAAPAFTLFTGLPAPHAHMRKALWKRRGDSRRNIALIGFMGTEKTAVGEALARRSGLTFTDVDRRIEERSGASVAEIFDRSGEGAFRRMEQEEIDGLRLVTHQVASCGGDAVLNRANVRVLRNTCLSIWLWADRQTILERTGRTDERPLHAGPDAGATVETLLRERLPLYAATSDLVINTEGKDAEEIAQRMWDEVRHAFGD